MAGFRRALICVLVVLTSHCYINAASTTVSTANTTLSTANTTVSTADTTQPDSTTTTTSTTNSQITNQTTTERNNSQSTTTQQTSRTVTNNPQTTTSISAATSNHQTITGVSVQSTNTTGGTASSPTPPPTGSQATAQTTLTVTSSVITQALTRTLQTTKATQSISLSTQNETTSQSTASETTSQSIVSETAPQSLVNVTAPQSIQNETTSQSTASETTSQSSVSESTSTSIQNKSTSHRSVSGLNSQFTSSSSGGSSTPTPTDVSANSSGVRWDTASKSIELTTSETTTHTGGATTASIPSTQTSTTTTQPSTTTPDRCRSSPCQNGGTCVNDVNTYNCSCKSGWEGKNCTVESDSCLTVDRNCTKPNERCVNKPGYQNFSCECLPKYYKKDGDCIKESLYKFELRYEEEYLRAYNDRTSTIYKERVKEIEAQVRKLNESLISDVTVKSLRKGSVIAKTFVTAKASQLEIEQYLNNSTLNATKQNLTAADYCIDINHDCDTVSTDCVPQKKGFYCKCKVDFTPIPQTTKYCMDMRRKTCSYNVCKHQGTCAINGPEIVCSCTEERTGKYCQERVVKKSNYDRLVKIFIGVTAGLGSLTLFFFLALIVFCCTEKKDQKYSSTSREPIDDDITIHNWMPSLPRPKIKPGSFADDSMEMNESQPIKRPTVRPQPGTDNPAFIPEADYDLDKYEGRHAINGKRNDYVYL